MWCYVADEEPVLVRAAARLACAEVCALFLAVELVPLAVVELADLRDDSCFLSIRISA